MWWSGWLDSNFEWNIVLTLTLAWQGDMCARQPAKNILFAVGGVSVFLLPSLPPCLHLPPKFAYHSGIGFKIELSVSSLACNCGMTDVT